MFSNMLSGSTMRITKLELENFRGFRHLVLDFHPELNVLVGVNGSGKTTVLDAIVQMLWWGWFGQDGPSHVDRKFGETNHRIVLELEHHGKTANGIFWSEEKKVVRRTGPITILKDELDFQKGPIPILGYLSALRSATDATSGSNKPQIWSLERVWKESLHHSRFDAFFQWFREREDLENADRLDDVDYRDRNLEAVRRALESLLPGFTKPRVRRPRFETGETFSTPVLTMSKDGQELAFSQLSEGERMMVAMVGDIARRLAIANPEGDPLAGEGVIMIDEIDLHLHPKWQASIVPALRRTFPNLQFIVTTHSPIVLGYVEPESVRLFHDFQVIQSPAKTAGRDPNSLYLEIFGVPLRPRATQERIETISKLIDQEKLNEARAELKNLALQLGEQDTEIIRLQSFIDFLEA